MLKQNNIKKENDKVETRKLIELPGFNKGLLASGLQKKSQSIRKLAIPLRRDLVLLESLFKEC